MVEVATINSEDFSYKRIAVKPIAGALGAEIEGVNIAAGVDQDTALLDLQADIGHHDTARKLQAARDLGAAAVNSQAEPVVVRATFAARIGHTRGVAAIRHGHSLAIRDLAALRRMRDREPAVHNGAIRGHLQTTGFDQQPRVGNGEAAGESNPAHHVDTAVKH